MPKEFDVATAGHHGDDELRMAARAGLILLEKNAALEVDVEMLSTEIHRYEVQHRELAMEVQTLRDQRKAAVMEVQSALKEVKTLQTQLNHERSKGHAAEQAHAAQVRTLTSELHQLKASSKVEANPEEENQLDSQNGSEAGESLTSGDDEDPRIAALLQENDDLQTQVNQVLAEMSQLQVEWSHSTYASNQRIQALEHDMHKLMRENKMLKEEQVEERELIESLRTMVQTYKKIADARPFSQDAGADSDSSDDMEGSAAVSSMHEDVMQANAALQNRVKELEAELEALHLPPTSPEVEAHIHHLEEQLVVAREMLKHTKQQWIAAVTAKKEAQSCAVAAHEEMARLQEALHAQTTHHMCHPALKVDENDNVDWMDDTVEHPAPPGDLHSPLIAHLLQHWTSDKTKWDSLSQWLQGAIHGRPTHSTVRFDRLSSEVSAGFIQLLVPLLREAHGVHVKVKRRTSTHVLSDLLLSVDMHEPVHVAGRDTLFLVS
ncbi:Aste57867_18842 [Aphanomyces stellatus]|uniref:Aste57867_18842 protein n=1 Tax=Aphanomyces stellatus TaxID=120398 RepID=A0A485LD35_9STRA|nr:hypothetical protein As57867_018778 [Aphanomyces stellatus]VFT95576.1 Aste57867_18842 [Aphanomyces stellatus]